MYPDRITHKIMITALPKVTILMATCNGAAHLVAQLMSIAAQDHHDWALWVSDDGSRDATRNIVSSFAAAHPNRDIRMFDGPQRGVAANFLSLLCHPDLVAGVVALSDQDDIWMPAKLTKALHALQGHYGVAVYSAQSRHVADDGVVIGHSRVHAGKPNFGNALVQNRVAGHCAVLSPAAMRLVRQVGLVDVPFHDWWIYLLIEGAGGRVIVSHDIVLDYRQHGANILGGNLRRFAGLSRMAMVLGSTFRNWQSRNIAALCIARPILSDYAVGIVNTWATAPPRGMKRVRKMAQLGMSRDRPTATAFLRLAAFLGRI